MEDSCGKWFGICCFEHVLRPGRIEHSIAEVSLMSPSPRVSSLCNWYAGSLLHMPRIYLTSLHLLGAKTANDRSLIRDHSFPSIKFTTHSTTVHLK